jgi:hypothetical protein
MAVQTLLLSPTAAIQNIVMLTELVVVAFVAFLHLFSSLWLNLMIMISNLDFPNIR